MILQMGEAVIQIVSIRQYALKVMKAGVLLQKGNEKMHSAG
jgi:hypothetical protein